MKLSWGTGIAIFYGAFMLFMILFVIKSREVDHSLVMENYYEEDIRYQSHMDKVANSKALEVDLMISQRDELLQLQFPDLPGTITGEIWFYRPNDNSRDFKMAIRPDDTRLLTVNTADLIPGRWKVKVQWQAGDKRYYKEKELYLQG